MTRVTTPIIDVLEALAGQLRTALDPAMPGVQVQRWMIRNPSPPAVDFYPAAVFGTQQAFGYAELELAIIIRARVTTIDHVAGQDLIYRLIDPAAPESMLAAVNVDTTLGGLVGAVVVDSSSGFTRYNADAVGSSDLLGCEFAARIVL